MTIQPYSDTAILINVEQKIEPTINAQVIHLYQAIQQANIKGVLYGIPTYCSLTLIFDKEIISYTQLKQIIESLKPNKNAPISKKKKTIPVCFDATYALDLLDIQTAKGLSKQEIVEQFCAQTYQVYMLGFLPGFAYMGRVPEHLACPRKTVPRKAIPAQSLGIAGQQTGIYPSTSPGGWQIIGRTPISVFDFQKANPFFFEVGDQVQFEPITKTQFENLAD